MEGDSLWCNGVDGSSDDGWVRTTFGIRKGDWIPYHSKVEIGGGKKKKKRSTMSGSIPVVSSFLSKQVASFIREIFSSSILSHHLSHPSYPVIIPLTIFYLPPSLPPSPTSSEPHLVHDTPQPDLYFPISALPPLHRCVPTYPDHHPTSTLNPA